jgi:hypothetical protein
MQITELYEKKVCCFELNIVSVWIPVIRWTGGRNPVKTDAFLIKDLALGHGETNFREAKGGDLNQGD